LTRINIICYLHLDILLISTSVMKTDESYKAKAEHYDLHICYSPGFNQWIVTTYPDTDINYFRSKSLTYLKRKINQYFNFREIPSKNIKWNKEL